MTTVGGIFKSYYALLLIMSKKCLEENAGFENAAIFVLFFFGSIGFAIFVVRRRWGFVLKRCFKLNDNR